MMILILMREKLPRQRVTTYASGVGSDSIISGDFMNPVPPMLVGLLIMGSGTRFLLPRAGMPLPEMAPILGSLIDLLGYSWGNCFLLCVL